MFFCIQNFILNSLHFQIASKWNYRLHSVLRCKFDYTFTGVSLCSYQVSRWIIFFRLGALVILCTSVPGLSLCCGIPRASTMTVSGLDSACVRLFLVFFGGGRVRCATMFLFSSFAVVFGLPLFIASFPCLRYRCGVL